MNISPLRTRVACILLAIMMLCSCQAGEQSTTHSPSSDSTEFYWDFSKPKKIVYTYSQISEAINQFGKDEEADTTYSSAKGKLNIRIKEDQQAVLSLTDVENKLITPGFGAQDTMTNQTPAVVIQGMKSDGSFEHESANILFDILFPLPRTTLAPGEQEALPLQMPFSANGSLLTVKGANTLLYEGPTTLDGRACESFTGTIEVADMEVPEEMKGTYASAARGTAKYYFNAKAHHYLGVDVELDIEILMDTSTPTPFGEEDWDMYMEMHSKTVIQVRFLEIQK